MNDAFPGNVPRSAGGSPLDSIMSDAADTVDGVVQGTIYIVEANDAVGQAVQTSLGPLDVHMLRFPTAGEFLKYHHGNLRGCLIVNVSLPDMSGMELQSRLLERHCMLPLVFLGTGSSVSQAVRVIRRGAVEFLDIPFQQEDLRGAVLASLELHAQRMNQHAGLAEFTARLHQLTTREREVFEGVVNGKSNKVIADELGVSEKTIQTHRLRLTSKLQVKSLAELTRMSLQLQALQDGFMLPNVNVRSLLPTVRPVPAASDVADE